MKDPMKVSESAVLLHGTNDEHLIDSEKKLFRKHALQLEKSSEIGRMLDRCTYPQRL